MDKGQSRMAFSPIFTDSLLLDSPLHRPATDNIYWIVGAMTLNIFPTNVTSSYHSILLELGFHSFILFVYLEINNTLFYSYWLEINYEHCTALIQYMLPYNETCYGGKHLPNSTLDKKSIPFMSSVFSVSVPVCVCFCFWTKVGRCQTNWGSKSLVIVFIIHSQSLSVVGPGNIYPFFCFLTPPYCYSLWKGNVLCHCKKKERGFFLSPFTGDYSQHKKTLERLDKHTHRVLWISPLCQKRVLKHRTVGDCVFDNNPFKIMWHLGQVSLGEKQTRRPSVIQLLSIQYLFSKACFL